MDDRLHGDPDFNNDSKATYDPESASHGSGMFSSSQNFTVTGQNFTNITNHYAASVPSDFRVIPLGDIDLRREISVDRDTGVVVRQREGTCVRRIYSAKVEGRKSQVTVAIYQGNSAEEEWRRDIAKYMSIRHPNIIQIYGAASSGNIHATLYHDELVPLQEFVDGYRKSHFATVYTYARCGWDLYVGNSAPSFKFLMQGQAVDEYIYSTFQRILK
ncbi:hypothetical protein DFH08DRAFT_419741 [Mycena albidolilacea]|uniref:Protein kinase domain-containing protein n=1 Tax=Mycena albidolilacea TaxID=1033008 RepID=A0AAD6ZD41_9AGAR|nr:hypothetical protein DFH08DRAFT_419741 [Mycena albidolilacea]